MKNSIQIWGLVFFTAVGQWAYAANTSSEDALENVCIRLLNNRGDRSALAELSHYSVSADGDKQLRSMAMTVYALAALAAQDTNAFNRAKSRHATDFPDQKYMIRFDIRDCFLTCQACDGLGFEEKTITCPTCKGSGKCTNKDCNGGRWIITAPGYGGAKRTTSALPCPVCKGQGLCQQCNGIQTIKSPCEKCNGKSVLFKCPPALSASFQTILRDMVTILRTGREFESQLNITLAETNQESRLALCDKLLKDFASHERIGEVRQIKRDLEASLQRELDQALDARAQIEKNIELLRKQAEKNPGDAGRTIQEYLEAHRVALTETDIIKLTGTMKECATKVEEKKKLQKTLYLAGGLLIVLLGLSCVNVHFYRYTFLPSPSSGGLTARMNRSTTMAHPSKQTSLQSRGRNESQSGESPSSQD